MKGKSLVGVWLALMVALAACGGAPADSPTDTSESGGSLAPTQPASENPVAVSGTDGGNPVDAARRFLELFVSGDDPSPYQCASVNAQNTEVFTPFPDLPGADSSIDVSGLVFNLDRIDGDTATVTLTGKVIVTLTIQGQDAAQEYDYDANPIILKLRNEDGWKVCA